MSRLLLQLIIVAAVFIVVICGSMPTILDARRDVQFNYYPDKLKLEDANAQRRFQQAAVHPEQIDNYVAAADELASVLIRQKRLAEASDIYQKEMAATWRLGADTYNDRWVSANNKAAAVLRDMSAFKAALLCYNSSLDRAKKFLKPDDYRIARELNSIGLIHYMTGLGQQADKDRQPEFKQAVDSYQKALPIALASGKKTLQAATLWNLYLATRDSGDKKAAADYEKQARAIDNSMHRLCTAP